MAPLIEEFMSWERIHALAKTDPRRHRLKRDHHRLYAIHTADADVAVHAEGTRIALTAVIESIASEYAECKSDGSAGIGAANDFTPVTHEA